MKDFCYRIGLDIGIGSVGWAVISGKDENAHIEDFGVRIFDSGENVKEKQSYCQERRGYRGGRRLVRRRHYRKVLLKNHFEVCGLAGADFNDRLAECFDDDVYALKVRALDEQLDTAQLYKCLAHTCNHRGYRDFYEDAEDGSEEGVNKSAVAEFDKAFEKSGKRTVSEYLLSDYKNGDFVKFRRNSADPDREFILIGRPLLRAEAEAILRAQSRYYPALSDKVIEQTLTIIFNQRDFEDGPGDKNDPTRRYHGFLDTIGICPFYSEDKRGHRGTVIADVYAVANTLSQYRYVDKATGEYSLPAEIAKELISHLLQNANLTMSDVKRILKGHGYELKKSEYSDDKALGKAIKYLKIAKSCVEAAGLDWSEIIGEEQFDLEKPSLLHRIGETISKYQTPSRRRVELKSTNAPDELIRAFSGKKISGTAGAGYRYMLEAINAFLRGDIYGNFQAQFLKNKEEDTLTERTLTLAPSCISDPDVRKNPVVFKAINETRKIINAIVAVYGSPDAVIIEVASELGKSFRERQEQDKRMRANEKANETVRENIAKLLKIEVNDVSGIMMDKYRLYTEQEGKCLYSGEPLGDLTDVLTDKHHKYEIDHIVPYSLILDNTLNNKALVYTRENQVKGQRTPLMYLKGEAKDRYIEFVNYLYSRKSAPISEKKLSYLRLQTIYSEEANSKLKEWKSRNINDTRYITKYIMGIVRKHLKFRTEEPHVHGVKGSVTSRFRKSWLRHCQWGEEQKDRSTYLNHAVDAVVVANLTPAYIEIGSDSIRLHNIFKKHNKRLSPEYDEYMAKCVEKMKAHYGFSEEYTRSLLTHSGKTPSYVRNLEEEVTCRFYEGDGEKFAEGIARCYPEHTFVLPPHMPITSHKQNKKFQGCIADSNPVRIVTVDGETYKLVRKAITAVTPKDMDKLYTGDEALRATLTRIFEGKGDSYTVEKYLTENGLTRFVTDKGQPVYKVTLNTGKYSNYYRKDVAEGNYTNLGMLKYYCVEVYKDTDGYTKTCGVRFVDLVKRGKKLLRKRESIPADYAEHVAYLFPNDYLRVLDKKGKVKFEGYYKAVYSIQQSLFYYANDNTPTLAKKAFTISRNDEVEKYDINILGRKGGRIKCSEPWSLTSAKE